MSIRQPAAFGPSFLVILFSIVLCSGGTVVSAQEWPEIFDPSRLLTLNLELDPGDWSAIQHDETLELEVPAQFWLDGEAPILVALRRKSGDPLNEAPGFTKVSLKIDINELVEEQTWHGLKKLSLENGDDQDVVTEGLAWYLQRLASGPAGYGHELGLAAWVNVVINGVDTGVYVSVEQRDKQFLRNRGLYAAGSTWLYKMSDIGSYELKVGIPESPTYYALCYSPFQSGGDACPAPGSAEMAAQLDQLIDMRGMMVVAAMEALMCSPDALFTHGKNVYFADFWGGGKRIYIPWDLDSVFSGGHGVGGFIPTGSAYADVILALPEVLAIYDEVMGALIHGPLDDSVISRFMSMAEDLIGNALAADPNSQIDGSIAEHFEGRLDWFLERLAEARELFPITAVTVPSPAPFGLRQNHPNPFNPATTIACELRSDGYVELTILDIGGRVVCDLHRGSLSSGRHEFSWDGRDRTGRALGSGVYLYRLKSREGIATRKMTLLR